MAARPRRLHEGVLVDEKHGARGLTPAANGRPPMERDPAAGERKDGHDMRRCADGKRAPGAEARGDGVEACVAIELFVLEQSRGCQKPRSHETTATIKRTMPGEGAAPMAIHAPPGPRDSATPSHAWAPHVKRLA